MRKFNCKKEPEDLQLKNAMRAKFDKILLPISEVLIDESQRKHITFDAFFANTMFHEVAHGLGIKEYNQWKRNGKNFIKRTCKCIGRRKSRYIRIIHGSTTS